jgi:hypothetical protein
MESDEDIGGKEGSNGGGVRRMKRSRRRDEWLHQ